MSGILVRSSGLVIVAIVLFMVGLARLGHLHLILLIRVVLLSYWVCISRWEDVVSEVVGDLLRLKTVLLYLRRNSPLLYHPAWKLYTLAYLLRIILSFHYSGRLERTVHILLLEVRLLFVLNLLLFVISNLGT